MKMHWILYDVPDENGDAYCPQNLISNGASHNWGFLPTSQPTLKLQTGGGGVMNPHSETGDSPDQIWEHIHDSHSWTLFTNHIHEDIHESNSQITFTNTTHNSISRTEFMNHVHKPNSQTRFMNLIHEPHSQTRFTNQDHNSFTIRLQSQDQTLNPQWTTINKIQSTINRSHLLSQQLQNRSHFTSVGHSYRTRTSGWVPSHSRHLFFPRPIFHIPLSLVHSNLSTMSTTHTKLYTQTSQIHTQTKLTRLTQTDEN